MEEKYLRYLSLLFFAFLAELVDGGLGMGFGVSLTTLLLSSGVGTAIASASVHFTEIATTLFSGVSHFKFGNVDKRIFVTLAISGVIGGSIGAFFAVKLQDITIIRPIISSIMLLMGLLIIVKYIRKRDILQQEYATPHKKHLIPLGLFASFVDAIGGGGWGPISTPVLVVNNAHPTKAIGSVNFAEFFVTLSISVTFFLTLPEIRWEIIIPMTIGGIITAPVAALITKSLPHKVLGIFVGMLIIFLSLRTILKATGIGFPF